MSTKSIKERCLEEARAIIGSEGLEALSLRQVAKRIGVSHQAPYKHFPSRDHLLAAVIGQCLQEFAAALRASATGEDGAPRSEVEAMAAMGPIYLGYAARNPLEYRLMFGTKWPDVAYEMGLEADSRAAFDVLRERLAPFCQHMSEEEHEFHAMYVWSSIHGIATVLQSGAMHYLSYDEDKIERAIAYGMARLGEVINCAPVLPAPD